MLELDEALDSELVRAREMVVELDQPGAQRPVRLLGVPVKLSRTPGDANRAPGPGLGEHTREVLAGLGYGTERDRRAARVGCRRGAGGRSPGVVPVVNEAGLLKMSELAERSGVSAGTIKHYLREGLLGEGDEIVRTSRNMAYYPPEYVERIQAHQAPAGGPLHAAAGDPRWTGSSSAAVERGPISSDVERAMSAARGAPALRDPAQRARPARRARRADAEPHAATTPTTSRSSRRSPASAPGGYDEQLGFTVFDTLRYREALEPLVQEEVRMLLDRLAGEVEVERAVEIIAAGAEPLRDLIGAMHSKLLLAELRRQHD